MTEYKIDLTDQQVRRLIDHLNSTTGVVDKQVAAQLEEQVNPAEPTEWGSIVFGRTCGVDPCHWQRDADGNWRSEHGALTERWSHFRTGVEVLRIGVGPSDFDRANMADESARLDEANALEDARAEGYKDGFRAGQASGTDQYARALGNAIYSVRHLRKTAITAERQDAYDKATAVIEALVGAE